MHNQINTILHCQLRIEPRDIFRPEPIPEKQNRDLPSQLILTSHFITTAVI